MWVDVHDSIDSIDSTDSTDSTDRTTAQFMRLTSLATWLELVRNQMFTSLQKSKLAEPVAGHKAPTHTNPHQPTPNQLVI